MKIVEYGQNFNRSNASREKLACPLISFQLKHRLIESEDETDPISNLLVRRVKIIKRYRMRFVLNEG